MVFGNGNGWFNLKQEMSMAMTAKQIRDAAAKLGIPMLPEDHPYYSEGSQVQFVAHKSKEPKKLKTEKPKK